MAEHDCPPQYHHGLRHIGPVIIRYGSEEQKRRFLPGILNGDDWWCQGYSEPNAGSDLASLRTAARREGDDYVVEGQKTWTSHAHESDWMYTLVRTSREEKKQLGISMLLIPLIRPASPSAEPHLDAVTIERVFPTRCCVPWRTLGEEGRLDHGKSCWSASGCASPSRPRVKNLERTRARCCANWPRCARRSATCC